MNLVQGSIYLNAKEVSFQPPVVSVSVNSRQNVLASSLRKVDYFSLNWKKIKADCFKHKINTHLDNGNVKFFKHCHQFCF